MNSYKDIAQRKTLLKKLLSRVIAREKDIIEALYQDFRKPAFESVATETSYVISDLKHTVRNLGRWAKPIRIWPSILNFPSTDMIYTEPRGNVLVIAPWNYPFQLALCPLVSAVAAGNNVVLKPSELAPATASIIEIIISEVFDPVHVEVFQGGAEVSERLLARRWDYIFFTGSVGVGKIVAAAAAKHLTPVTLELGGKNPCIVDRSANVGLAAKRIVWGKFINAGQTCIAPDYILADSTIVDQLVSCLRREIESAYGENPKASPDFARIINDRHFERLSGLMDSGSVVIGGERDASENYIAPTVILNPGLESAVMEGEIFGPILPIVTFGHRDQISEIIRKYEHPLALYVFSSDNEFAKEMIGKHSFGGGCINDTVIHFANNRLPFGGVGQSGMGAYHGRLGFETFSHKKSVVKKATWYDNQIRYAPYTESKFRLMKKIMDWL